MKCPFCGNEEDKVLETRTNTEDNFIKRKRECLSCGKKWITHETIEMKPLWVIKSDGRKELFDTEKIIRGMEIACRKRPVAPEELTEAAERIYFDIRKRDRNEVSSDMVGNFVCDYLKQIDMVAYIRFASVYRQFESVEEFKKLIDEQ